MESNRSLTFSIQDQPLREDVRRLGALVGKMLAEQEGEAFYAQIEAIRTAAIQRRQSRRSTTNLNASLAGLETGMAGNVARAFSTYFQAVNMAEMVHRIRRRRDYQRTGERAQPESLQAVLEQLRAEGVSAEALWEALSETHLEPVFTAHPTESMRRSLLDKQTSIAQTLVDGFDPSRTPQERQDEQARIYMALSGAWQTVETAPVAPSVQDEHRHVSYYLAKPLYLILPSLYRSLSEALQQVYGLKVQPPDILRFGTWVGGDMDGNPKVGASTIAASLTAQREALFANYRQEFANLAEQLSQSLGRVDIDAEFAARLEHYRTRFPQVTAELAPRYRNMPYREFLRLVTARLAASDGGVQGYAEPLELDQDLALIEHSLRAHRGQHAGLYHLLRLRRRVSAFGFHLARLDLRQDSQVHDEALAARLADPAWLERSPEERAQRLGPYASGERELAVSEEPIAQRTEAVFAELAAQRRRQGPAAIGLYIISMARSAADVLAVLALARQGGLVETDASGAMRVPLDIAPLFEIVEDLRRAPETLSILLADPVYRAHLAARGDRQWIMLGYSDSGKDSGMLAARWAVQRAQVELLEVAQAAGIRLAFFHGRGGSTSRGGGRITRALDAAPPGSVAGVLRLTEQGEVIHRRYGMRALALRHLEQSLGAVLKDSLGPRSRDARLTLWREHMDQLAGWSREVYRDLVEHPDFVAYFRAATPIDVIENMSLGSRPSRRRDMRGVQDLRAIPWVFAWTQCRAILTGWYGLGSALTRGLAVFGQPALAEMAREWPFFANLLDDAEMVLAKCDLDIAAAFSALSGPLHEPFFTRIQAEFQRSCDAVLTIRGRAVLLADQPQLARSIALRNPYVDPMSLLEVDLLRRWREQDRPQGELFEALLTCINGVAQGLQNTG